HSQGLALGERQIQICSHRRQTVDVMRSYRRQTVDDVARRTTSTTLWRAWLQEFICRTPRQLCGCIRSDTATDQA
ncbi:MAG: hypothetical protein NXI32_30380, partial [bacterium]|nr:hypothetical protein [bacterium]